AEERISRLPGVKLAWLTTVLPLEGHGEFLNDIHIEGRPPEPPGRAVSAQLTWVTPNYFKTLEIPVVRGRGFEASDRWRSQPVLVVNEAFVRRFLPNEEPIGARVRIFN